MAADPGDPRILYLGTSDGHIFTSADGGEHWHLLSRVGSRHDSVVMALLVDARDSRRLFAATWTLGANGGGVFRSEDSGHSWEPSGLVGKSVRALAQAPSQPELLVAGTLEGVFRSHDKGKTWERISPAEHADLRNIDSVAIDPHRPEIIYAGTYHLAWKTADSGRTWVPIHSGMLDDSDVMNIEIDRTKPERIYATACSGIYRSETRGEPWTKIRGIPPSARRTHFIRLDPQRPQTLYAGTTEGLWKSADDAITWKRVTPANWSISALLIHPRHPDRLVLGTERRGVMVSDDGGKSFRASNEGFYHQQIVAFAADRERPERMLVVLTNAAQAVLATRDGGRNWFPMGVGLKPEAVRRVFGASGGWWATLEGGGLVRYDEKKASWLRAQLVQEKKPVAGARRKPRSPSGSTRTFRPLTHAVHDIAFSRDRLFAATSDGLLVSRDHGATWSQFPIASPKKLRLHSVRVSADGSKAWALAARALLYSHDAAQTWKWHELPFEADGNLRLHQADEETFLVASNRNLYISHDAGRNWNETALPELFIEDLAVVGDALLVSTRKAGLHLSYDRGQTWTQLSGPVAEGRFPVVARAGSTPVLLAASATEGLYAVQLSPLLSKGPKPHEPAAVAREQATQLTQKQ